jgi:hypothetical protein
MQAEPFVRVCLCQRPLASIEMPRSAACQRVKIAVVVDEGRIDRLGYLVRVWIDSGVGARTA